MNDDTQSLATDAEIEELRRQEMKKFAEENTRRLMDYYSRGRQPTAITFNPQSPEGAKQVGPNAYEIEAPGYNSSGEVQEPLTYEDYQLKPEPHIHGPFNCLLNANHNALRWCVACGQSWAGNMSIIDGGMRWHVVEEVPEEE